MSERTKLFLGAIFYLGTSCWFIFVFDWEPWVEEHDFWGFIAMITSIVFLWKGINCWGFFGRTYGVQPQYVYPEDHQLENIARAREYRESKLNAMNQKKGAKLIMDTRALDTPYDPNSATGDAMRYMNSRLGSLNNEDGIKYLKGEID